VHVQLITYRLAGITPAQFARRCEEVAPQFARLPGLLAKVWLGDAAPDAAAGAFGGVYLWRDREALERFRGSEAYAALRANPALADLADRDFPVLEAPSRITALVGAAAAG
jgi:hypothetical protein